MVNAKRKSINRAARSASSSARTHALRPKNFPIRRTFGTTTTKDSRRNACIPRYEPRFMYRIRTPKGITRGFGKKRKGPVTEPDEHEIGQRKRCFDLLPKEILMEIIRQLFPCSTHGFHSVFYGFRGIIRNVSLVNRQMRGAVLRLSEMWAYIDLDVLKNDTVDLFLLRSRGRPLSVSINYTQEKDQSIFKILEHKDRIVYLNLEFWFSQPEILADYPPVVLTTVKCINIHGTHSRSYSDAVFSRLSFPNAQSVDLGNLLPKRCEPSFSRTSMETLRIEPDFDGTTDDDTYFSSLSGFLLSATWLQNLTLDVSDVFVPGDSAVWTEVELPELRRFAITNSRGDGVQPYDAEDEPMSLEIFGRIAKIFRLPNIRRLVVSLSFIEPTFNLSSFLNKAFPASNGMRGLVELDFNLQWLGQGGSSARLRLPLDVLLSRFPNVETFSIQAPLFNPLWAKLDSKPRLKLRTLSIGGFDAKPKYLNKLCDELFKRGPNIERVVCESEFDLDRGISEGCRTSAPFRYEIEPRPTKEV